jgi:hypothetical protein
MIDPSFRRGMAPERKQRPEWLIVMVCVWLGALVLPLELIFFLMCRPDLGGRRSRARLITPRDIRRILFAKLVPASILLNRLRM